MQKHDYHQYLVIATAKVHFLQHPLLYPLTSRPIQYPFAAHSCAMNEGIYYDIPDLACAVVLPAIPEDGVLLMVLWRKVHSTGRRFLDLTESVGECCC